MATVTGRTTRQLLDGEQDLTLPDGRVDLDVDQFPLERRQARLPAAMEISIATRLRIGRRNAARFGMQQDRPQEAIEADDPVTALDAVMGPEGRGGPILQPLVKVGAGALLAVEREFLRAGDLVPAPLGQVLAGPLEQDLGLRASPLPRQDRGPRQPECDQGRDEQGRHDPDLDSDRYSRTQSG